jgi:hypothetical protein
MALPLRRRERQPNSLQKFVVDASQQPNAGKRLLSRREFRSGGMPATEYALTEHGLTLRPIFEALSEWGTRHLQLDRA